MNGHRIGTRRAGCKPPLISLLDGAPVETCGSCLGLVYLDRLGEERRRKFWDTRRPALDRSKWTLVANHAVTEWGSGHHGASVERCPQGSLTRRTLAHVLPLFMRKCTCRSTQEARCPRFSSRCAACWHICGAYRGCILTWSPRGEGQHLLLHPANELLAFYAGVFLADDIPVYGNSGLEPLWHNQCHVDREYPYFLLQATHSELTAAFTHW